MDNQPKNNNDNGPRGNNHQNDNSGYEDAPESGRGIHNINDTDAANDNPRDDNEQNDNSGYEDAPESGEGIDDTDKYLALEQPGVTYTQETDPTVNSDHTYYDGSNDQNTWNDEGGNSRYSDAFNQDDYILEDNLDLDEDQNQSISSDDEDFEETNERY